MAWQMANAVKWCQDNIGNYRGDKDQLFLTGHSAGGHLVALISTHPKYGIDPKAISGVILNDAAALDMHHYLLEHPPTNEKYYLTTWTDDPNVWMEASPINFVNKDSPPFMMYLGAKTYPSIKTGYERFLKVLKPLQPEVAPILLNRKHIPMVTQYFLPWNKRYKEIVEFIRYR